MRLSDWSSDFCSSALAEHVQRVALHPLDQFRAFQTLRDSGLGEEEIAARFFVGPGVVKQRLKLASVSPKLLDLYAEDDMTLEQLMAFTVTNDHDRQEQVKRSEEHTSELQSLMRISYAVFCLKKKTKRQILQAKNKKQKTSETN